MNEIKNTKCMPPGLNKNNTNNVYNLILIVGFLGTFYRNLNLT